LHLSAQRGEIQQPANLKSSEIFIREPMASDASEFIHLVKASRSLHKPWTNGPDTLPRFGSYLECMAQPNNVGFLICKQENSEIVGVVNLTSIVLGLFRSGYLGYYVFSGHERQGHMTKGLQLVVRHAFNRLKLHRLEANIRPKNVASIALVKRCGFLKEGYSPRYLKIGGRWRDHERWAIVAS
jgi:ribosomal-protein-alanine N-acetyltransferase